MTVQAIFLRDGAQWVRVPVQDILYLEADDNSTRVCGVQRSYTIGRMLKEVLVELSSDHMERIHRSYAVNIERVHAISDQGVHVGDRWLPIGRSYRPSVLQRLRLL